MYYSSTIFGQLLTFLPRHKLRNLVGRHDVERYVKKITAWNHLVVLLYAQASSQDSLRSLENSLKVHIRNWHHLGIKSVSRSSIARVNNTRDPIVFEKLFYEILTDCKQITAVRTFTFDNPLYSLDATVVNLCLSLFNWAKYQSTKGALKIHTVIDNRTALPVVLSITDGKTADINGAKGLTLDLPEQSILVFDRGYLDFAWWKELDTKGLFFVSRAKTTTQILVNERGITPTDKRILADDMVWVGDIVKNTYGKLMRYVSYRDDAGKEFVFLTNNTKLSAVDIALVYKERWQIELFFKWIKQNLKIKTYLGTSQTAVKNQIWVAMIYYLVLSYIKFQTRYPGSLLEFTWVLKSTLLSRRSLIDLLSLTQNSASELTERDIDDPGQEMLNLRF